MAAGPVARGGPKPKDGHVRRGPECPRRWRWSGIRRAIRRYLLVKSYFVADSTEDIDAATRGQFGPQPTGTLEGRGGYDFQGALLLARGGQELAREPGGESMLALLGGRALAPASSLGDTADVDHVLVHTRRGLGDADPLVAHRTHG